MQQCMQPIYPLILSFCEYKHLIKGCKCFIINWNIHFKPFKILASLAIYVEKICYINATVLQWWLCPSAQSVHTHWFEKYKQYFLWTSQLNYFFTWNTTEKIYFVIAVKLHVWSMFHWLRPLSNVICMSAHSPSSMCLVISVKCTLSKYQDNW